MYCKQCGTELEATNLFCSRCGSPTTVQTPQWGATAPRLSRSLYDKKIAGVCGGLGRYLDVDSTFVRLIWLVSFFCFPPVLLGYIAAWIVMPKEAPQLSAPFGAGLPQAQGF